MHRSSESIAALAAALAKAQRELANPEKSLVAIIGPDRPGEGAKSFRYAPLSSGLDIIRKALGPHQIATVQTTAIDAASGTVNLTTVLAHESGEWISSDWPVCRIADTASQHRMGAALTYARRYALFTLVGIAGEDDLDAPDLNGRPHPGAPGSMPPLGEPIPEKYRKRQDPNGRDTGRVTLAPSASAALRDELVREVARLGSLAEPAKWARTAISTKNKLSSSDSRLVELAFELRLSAFEDETSPSETARSSGTPADGDPALATPGSRLAVLEPANDDSAGVSKEPSGIDKSVLPIGEARRYRDKTHLKFVASQSCLICGRRPADPHHLHFAQKRALGRKVSDEFSVPLCRLHHRELHRSGNEARWWKSVGLDPLRVARSLWRKTRLPSPGKLPKESPSSSDAART
jgi:ERF superfamily protein